MEDGGKKKRKGRDGEVGRESSSEAALPRKERSRRQNGTCVCIYIFASRVSIGR